MKNTFYLILSSFVLTLFLADTLKAQSNNWCLTDQIINQEIQQNPELLIQMQKSEELISRYLKNNSNNNSKSSNATYVVPVVFHILHENGPENISSSLIKSAINRLNIDYQKLNSDTSQVAPTFQNIIGDMDVEFRLATKDPNGNCTNGITRTFDPVFTNHGGCPSGSCGAMPGSWPHEKYLNIWIVKQIGNGGSAAYSRLAQQNVPDGFDGIVCRYQFVGANDRTLTHEAGHYFNLWHVWADLSGGVGSGQPGFPSNCNFDDQVGDTPNTIGQSGGCNLSANTCPEPGIDNVQNYMNYASCSIMFTAGQVRKMKASIDTLPVVAGGRSQLVSPANLIATGTDDASYQTPSCPPTADFVVSKNKECEGGTFTFTNRSFHAFASASTFTYNWTLNGATPASSTMQNPTVTYNTAGMYDVSLAVSLPGTTTNTNLRSNLIEITPGSGTYIAPYLEQVSDPTWPNNSDASLNWSREKPQGSLFQFQRSTNGYYSPPSSIYLNNFSYNNTGQFELITPVADLTNMQAGSTFLNFQVAHAQRGTEQEGISLWISTDCGETFTFNKAWGGSLINTAPPTTSVFVPADTSEWSFISHDISSLAGLDNIQFRFRFSAAGGNNIWLDDIHISDSDQPVPLTVGLRQDLFSEFNLYPNPNEGVFTLEFNVLGNDKVEAEIVDMIGKSTPIEFAETITSGWNTATIDTRNYNLKPGMYFLKLESGDQVFSKRLMIQ